MKFAKVDHTKAAVSTEKNAQKGIIYPDPAKGSPVNLGKHVGILTSKAKKLRKSNYDIFNNEKLAAIRKLTEGESVIIRVNRYFKDIVKYKDNIPSVYDLADELSKLKLKSSEDSIKKAIDDYIRKALSKKHTREAILLLITKAMQEQRLTSEEAEKIQRDFINVMQADCECKGIKDNVIKGIGHQNMRIQPVSQNGQQVLAPSVISKQKSSKADKRNAFRKMLTDYAVIEADERRTLLCKLRRLIVLYIYGEDAVPQGVFNVWDDHTNRRSNAEKLVPCDFETDKYGNVKKDSKVSESQLKDRIREENIRAYRSSKEAVMKDAEQGTGLYFDDQNLNLFWLERISQMVESLFKHRLKGIQEYKLTRGFVSEKIWKEAINYLSINYIAIGKAVYNTATMIDRNGTVDIGTLQEDYKDGINSFDYEMIKAEEVLQRETAVYVSFAVNNLARATMDPASTKKDKEEDILSIERGRLEELAYEDSRNKILQFFDGQSEWDDFDFAAFEERNAEDDDGSELLWTLHEILKAMRNESFHFYTANKNQGAWNQKLMCAMFQKDAKAYSRVLRDKYYSNNLPMFYKTDDLEAAMHRMYDKVADRSTQIPSFGKVFVRNTFPVELNKIVGKVPGFDTDTMAIWQSAVYYILKEIYYNGFVNDEASKQLFLDAVRNLKANDKDEQRAVRDFRQKVDEIKKYRLPVICQIIMTEQNQQNQGNPKKKSAEREKNSKSIFKHYKMLLYMSLRDAFTQYWTSKYSFLKTPVLKKIPAAEEFLPDFSCGRYDGLVEEVRKNPELQKWYSLSRMINSKQANHLAGAVRSYIQYVNDVQRRAKESGNNLNRKANTEMLKMLTSALEVMDISIQLSGTTSKKVLTDYFRDEDEYASFVSNYLDYDSAVYTDGISASGRLKAFCNQECGNERVGIFYDGENPIMNRNILLAKLYGNNILLSAILKDSKVTYEDICELKQNDSKIKGYKTTGKCATFEERKELSSFQSLKNHVEFRDLVDYTELVDELQGQLINWAYLRERDLMYFQLGFHYTCLVNSNCQLEQYQKLVTPEGIIDNAVLYQIVAMYTNGIKIFDPEEDRKVSAFSSTGAKVGSFLRYSKIVDPSDKKGERIYTAGLELFENIEEHDNITLLRDYIDHFKYYDKQDRSILNMYSEVFDRFFSYDMKYRKNVVNLLYNILLRHFVVARFNFGTSTKTVGMGDKVQTKEMARIRITGDNGIVSEKFTYKLEGDKKVEIFARGEKYLNNVARILCYPDDVPKCVVNGIHEAIVKDEAKQSKRNYDKPKNNNRSKGAGSGGDKPMKLSTPEPKGETAFERALREAREKKERKGTK